MGFKTWFKLWKRSLYKILTFDRKRKRTREQREKERLKRIRNKHSYRNFYRMTKRERKHRRRTSAADRRLLEGLIGLALTSVAIILLPLGLFDWAKKSSAEKRRARAERMRVYRAHSGANYKSVDPTSVSRGAQSKNVSFDDKTKGEGSVSHGTGESAVSKDLCKKENGSEPTRANAEIFAGKGFASGVPRAASTVAAKAPASNDRREEKPSPSCVSVAEGQNENVPKSKPKNEKDQYVRKRFTVMSPESCELMTATPLSVGSYLGVEFDGACLTDKEAVKITYNGTFVGHVEIQDRLALVTCLKLGRRLYGVVTDLFTDGDGMRIELEVWIEFGVSLKKT